MGGPKARHPDRSTIVTPHADRPPVLLLLVLFAGLLSMALALAALSPSDGPAPDTSTPAARARVAA